MLGVEHPEYAEALFGRATAREKVGNPSGARSDLEEAVSILSRAQGDGHPRTQAARIWLGAVLFRSGALVEATTTFERARNDAQQRDPPDISTRVDAEVWLGQVAFERGDRDRAEEMLRAAEQGAGDALGDSVRERMERLRAQLGSE